MKKSNDGDSALSSFDVKNKDLIEALNTHSNSTGKQRDVLARELMGTFLKFTEFMSVPALEGSGVHPDLLNLAIDGIREYVNGGSFDLFVGGQTTKNPNGRPNKKRRNDAIRLSVALNIDDGADVVAATTLTSEQLAIGEVDGLPVVTLTPAAIRSIWYAAPLGLLTSEQEQEQETAPPVVPPDSFEELKNICLDHSTAYLKHSPQVLKVLAGLSNVDEKKLGQLEYIISRIAECDGPCAAFHFEKTDQEVKS